MAMCSQKMALCAERKKKLNHGMFTMRHHNRRALTDKQTALNMFNSHKKAKEKSCNTGISAPCHSSVCSNNKTEERFGEPQKTKRLKTIKQRNQIREQGSSRSNRSHQHCVRRSKDKGPCSECKDCQCSHALNFSRKEKPVAKPFPLQKPSIITEGRLTSIRGLFSHEVRSVDIERLIKEKKHQKHIEMQERQATASPSPSCLIPHSTPPAVISERSEEGIFACANKDEKSFEKTDHLHTNLEDAVPMTIRSGIGKHGSAQTPKATDNTTRSGNPSDQEGVQEAVILSSSESEPVHKSFPTSVKVTPSYRNVIPIQKNTQNQRQTNKATATMDVQHDFVNTERLDTPVGSEVLNSDAPQFDPSPAIFMFSSPTLDKERSALGDECQHKKPGFSSKEEEVRRLAASLCHNLGSFPLQRCCPLLTECRNVLLHHLQERHGSQLQHSLHRLHSHLSGPHSPQTGEQVWPSTVQKHLDNTQKYFSYTRKHEDDQPIETMELQTDNGSQKHSQQEDFCENVGRGTASKRQRKQTWGIYSPQAFHTKVQRPCQDTLSQWSLTAQTQESPRAKRHSNSQTFSLHQASTGPQTQTPWTYSCTNRTLGPFFLEPQKQVKLGSGENRRRNSTALPLLEQWRNDSDFNFLFQDENSKKTHTSLGPLTELRPCSPQYNIERVSERQLFGASSSVSAFFPPEGFCYEPYYRFPHPSNSFNRSEKFGMTLYTQTDVEKWGLDPSLHLTTPYF
ncbi:hypothetical protein AMELA_G00082370 [Ameiurus melas]|uniref:Uncharacterized protein n=1 Tax=Ameiurus melas TaxID=219545 RepID=A0A7J6B3U3_AMEME|nr:hypothetical protein AMELA_G00082370 [Ameiurus melas]